MGKLHRGHTFFFFSHSSAQPEWNVCKQGNVRTCGIEGVRGSEAIRGGQRARAARAQRASSEGPWAVGQLSACLARGMCARTWLPQQTSSRHTVHVRTSSGSFVTSSTTQLACGRTAEPARQPPPRAAALGGDRPPQAATGHLSAPTSARRPQYGSMCICGGAGRARACESGEESLIWVPNQGTRMREWRGGTRAARRGRTVWLSMSWLDAPAPALGLSCRCCTNSRRMSSSRGVISRACSRRSSCSCRSRETVEISPPLLPATAACSCASGLATADTGTPLIVEQ